ncbi:ABC transporter ATP-binding protein [Kallotenue papyrolyticum]|uniref:ABC transporter ATP-binding protein n=1 Tax=Kallotenue papyrolyticum TaxID=1325125 RepID=UPI00047865ED|nr:ABC transporter ATP-binding protein [Kallotenue papyrolyticum]
MSELRAIDLTLGYDHTMIIEGLHVSLPSGQITALVGPNGCGKSTLLRGLARLLRPRGGAVYLDGVAIARLPTKAVAKQLGILPQSPQAPEGLTVRELVAQGRYPHQRWFQQWSHEDEELTQRALAITNMLALADRPVDALSGGQRQRAWIAMTLAQNTAVLLLDEPTTFLDMAHQLEVLQLLHELNRREGRTVVMVVHDLNHAARYADHLVAMAAGRVVAEGPPQAVVTPAMLREVFGVEADVIPDPRTGLPLCIPHSLHGAARAWTAPAVPDPADAGVLRYAEHVA